MATNKVLFAINSLDGENKIEDLMRKVAVKAGAVQYREAILPALENTGADILLLKESLNGSMDLLQMLRSVRSRYPNVRVIFLANERSNRRDPFFGNLVALGIYDIINQNTITFETIYSYIVEPRTFRDVAQYYNGVPEGWVNENAPEKEEKGGVLSGLFGGRKPSKPTAQEPVPQTVSAAQPDMEALRSAIQEEADRKASAKVEEIAKKLAADQTKELSAKLKDVQQQLVDANNAKHTAEEQHYSDLHDLEVAKQDILSLKATLESMKMQHGQSEAAMRAQLETLKTTDSPEIFQKKLDEWMKKEREYQAQIRVLETKVKEAKASQVVISSAPDDGREPDIFDFTGDELMKYIMPDDGDYVDVKNTNVHSYLFTGTKHGVGNTTVALNTAASLADNRYKTLLIEFNSSFPFINSYFEFLSVPRGIDTAIRGLHSGNYQMVDASIIKPHAIRTENKALAKAYKDLPSGLHFMCFSNRYLCNKGQNLQITAQDIEALITYLVKDLGYLYIILDIQVDDEIGKTILFDASSVVDRLVLTCTQDVQTISTLSVLLKDISESPAEHLLRDMKIVVNSAFSGFGEMSVANIAKHLNLNQKRFFTVGEDRMGHYKATYGFYPYVLKRGKNARDYRNIAAMM